MNFSVRHLLLAVATASLAFGLTIWLLQNRPAPADEQAWMRSEFKLTLAQETEIARLHAEYQPICAEHCAQVLNAREKLTRAVSAADKTAAQADLTRLEAVCGEATRDHLQRVAAVMDPEQGERFLSLVGPKVAAQTHDAPLGLK